MRDDDMPTDAERRLSAALRPDDQGVRSLVTRVLSSDRRTPSAWRYGVLGVVVAALLVVTGALVWRRPAPSPPALHISGSGSVVVVTSDDGRRWLLDARRDSGVRGEYVIAFPQ